MARFAESQVEDYRDIGVRERLRNALANMNPHVPTFRLNEAHGAR